MPRHVFVTASLLTLLLAVAARAQQDAPPATQEPTSESGRSASPPAYFERQAEEENDQGPQSPGFNQIAETGKWPWTSTVATGDWGGARDKLGESGIVFTSTSTTDLATVVSGGQRQGFIMPYLIDTNLSIDTQKLGLWAGGQVFIDFQQAGSTQLGSKYLPDFWGWDAIYPYTQNFSQLAQYWYMHSFAEGALKLKFGKIDANTDFAVTYPGLQFINSAAYFPGGMVVDLPTYPNQAGGAEIMVEPVPWFGARFGFFDGTTNHYDTSTGGTATPTGGQGLANFLWDNPGSYFLIGEVGPHWSIDDLVGHASVGWYQQTGRSTESSPAVSPSPPGQAYVDGPWGLYLSGSQQLFQTSSDAGLQSRLAAFGQFGWSPPSLNPSQWSLMGGMSWQGVLPGRPNDTLGSLVAYTHFSNQPNLGASPGSGEFIVEGFYNFQVTPWLGVQPDVQFINQPSNVPGQSVPNAVVLTVRITMSF